MWVTDENIWLFYIGNIGLILFLYVMKSVALRYNNQADAALTFAMAVALCIPITWAFFPDWNNPHLLRRGIGIYLWIPFATLTVPIASLLIDLFRQSERRPREWLYRLPVEMLIAVPICYYSWAIVSLVIGFYWI